MLEATDPGSTMWLLTTSTVKPNKNFSPSDLPTLKVYSPFHLHFLIFALDANKFKSKFEECIKINEAIADGKTPADLEILKDEPADEKKEEKAAAPAEKVEKKDTEEK